MMNLYGADHHLLVLSDAIEADEHRHSFVQVTVALEGAFEIQIGGQSLETAGIVVDSNVRHRLDGAGRPLLLLLMDGTSALAASFKRMIAGSGYAELSGDAQRSVASFVQSEYRSVADSESYETFFAGLMERFRVEYALPGAADPRIGEVIRFLNFRNSQIYWDGNDTYVQKEGIVRDFGIFDSPDAFFSVHRQKLSPVRRAIYRRIVRHLMNRNVGRIRDS